MYPSLIEHFYLIKYSIDILHSDKYNNKSGKTAYQKSDGIQN